MGDSFELARKGLEVFGTGPAKPEEVAKARQLLQGAPTSNPVAVARYLAAITDVNGDNESFIAEWRVRSNPLIVQFFLEATDYGAGATDQTAWCAAFVNWCLKRAARPYTNSASSGSFRCFGVESPGHALGDAAVFKNAGEDLPCSGKGHVAFWLSDQGDYVEVLGGNQGDRIKISRYPTRPGVATGSTPWLMTIRRLPVV